MFIFLRNQFLSNEDESKRHFTESTASTHALWVEEITIKETFLSYFKELIA